MYMEHKTSRDKRQAKRNINFALLILAFQQLDGWSQGRSSGHVYCSHDRRDPGKMTLHTQMHTWYNFSLLFCKHYLFINSILFQGLMDAHEQFKQTLGEADKEYNAIMALVHEIQRISQQYGIQNALENPYSTLQANVSFS